MSLYIPIRGSDHFVAVSSSDLPLVDNVVNVLRAELAPLNIWNKIAVAYRNAGRIDDFVAIMNIATAEDVGKLDVYARDPQGRVGVLNTFAGHFIEESDRETDAEKKRIALDSAAEKYNRADKIDDLNRSTWLGKGMFLLKKGKLKEAGEALSSTLKAEESHGITVPAHLLNGCVLFQQGNFIEALREFRDAIVSHPGLPAAARLGPALCYVELGQLDSAKKAFNRVLQLDPRNVDALTGLAVIGLSEDSAESRKTAMEQLKHAFELDNGRSAVLNLLARHFYERGDFEKVNKMAVKAFQNTTVKKMRGESYFYLARVHHAENRLEEATKAYIESEKLWPENPLLQFPLGQMYFHRGQYQKAKELFEKHYAQDPECPFTLKALGAVNRILGDTERAASYYRTALELTKNTDAEVLIELSRLLELSDPKLSSTYLENALRLLIKTKKPVPAELYHNAGVLRQRQGDYIGAEKAYRKSLVPSVVETMTGVRASEVTTVYNLARLAEDTKQPRKAETLYRLILASFPDYTDCNLRLAIMTMDTGDLNTATEFVKEALKYEPNSPNALCIYGNICVLREEWNKAIAKFKQMAQAIETQAAQAHALLKQQGTQGSSSSATAARNAEITEAATEADDYAQLSIGNTYLSMASKEADAAKVQEHLDRAFDIFKTVLKRNPRNIFAANGLGCILGEKGFIKEAKDCFSLIRESTNDFKDSWLNLAHTICLSGEYQWGVKMYEKILKEFHSISALSARQLIHTSRAGLAYDRQLHLYLARAHFEIGNYEAASVILEKLRHIESDPVEQEYMYFQLWHNLCIVTEEMGKKPLRRGEGRDSSVADIRMAMNNLLRAKEWFQKLIEEINLKIEFDKQEKEKEAEGPRPVRLFFSATQQQRNYFLGPGKKHINSIDGLIARLNSALAQAERLDERETTKKQHQRNLISEVKQSLAEKKEREKAEEAARVAAIEERLKIQQEKQEHLVLRAHREREINEEAERADKQQKKPAGSRKKRTREEQGDDARSGSDEESAASSASHQARDEDDNDGQQDDDQAPAEKDSRKLMAELGFGMSDDEGDDDKPAQKKSSEAMDTENNNDDDDNNEDDGDAAAAPTPKKRKIITDDDDE
eukprot:comp22457_c0_seq1/m.55291 comp22457_c0_seq1/g.55291  ORF comp22457_c0_seq1/g.55291 comp22457_c0_seq1/m.55291 type:complete len:1117 (+) comp22457_c0_seq1:115-3465(+)